MRKMFERDAQNAASGYYPDSLLSFLLRGYLPVMAEALSDAPRMWWSRQRSEFALDAEPDRYPPCHRRRFHWQPDGWLSDHSARVYDVEVEFLFWNCADIIRRMAIPPLVDGLRGRARPRVLDVGCGTGRFLRMLEVALPEVRLYGVDLSPHDAARARREAKRASILVDNAQELPIG